MTRRGSWSVRAMASTLTCPHPPVAASTTSTPACFPANSARSQATGSRSSLPPGRSLGAGRGADDLAVDEEVDAGLSGELAAADEEAEVAAGDLERRRREGAGRVVAAVKTAGEAVAGEAGDGHLAGQRARRGSGAEGGAGRGPVAVGVGLEVGDEDAAVVLRRVAAAAGPRRSGGGGGERRHEGEGDHGATTPIGGLAHAAEPTAARAVLHASPRNASPRSLSAPSSSSRSVVAQSVQASVMLTP